MFESLQVLLIAACGSAFDANPTHHSTANPTHHSTTFSTKFLRASGAGGKSGCFNDLGRKNRNGTHGQKFGLVWLVRSLGNAVRSFNWNEAQADHVRLLAILHHNEALAFGLMGSLKGVAAAEGLNADAQSQSSACVREGQASHRIMLPS